MDIKICQSCGMPMQEEDQFGTELNDTKNDDYCCYCYQKGKFVQDCTMEQMAEFCAKFEVEGGRCKTLDEAKEQLMNYFPQLKRWKEGIVKA